MWSEDPISPAVLSKLDETTDLAIKQLTPVRVLHRRSLLLREKMVYRMKTRFINPHHFLLEIEASGGTYIKEFVHGDLGRTQPNISGILVGLERSCEAEYRLRYSAAGCGGGRGYIDQLACFVYTHAKALSNKHTNMVHHRSIST